MKKKNDFSKPTLLPSHFADAKVEGPGAKMYLIVL